VLLLGVRMACACALLLASQGCASNDPAGETGGGAQRPGVNADPSLGPGPYDTPPAPDLSTPASAVRSYLDWVTLAYRLANPSLVQEVCTPAEAVRVDAYVELNRQEGQAIEQHLEVFEVRETRTMETTAAVVTYEEWRYRYFTLDAVEYVGRQLEASYDATYTVLRLGDGRWRVDAVEAVEAAPRNAGQ